MFNFTSLFPKKSKKILQQCERIAPIFWVMHELEETPDWVQVDFLNFDNRILQSERMLYNTAQTREEALIHINQIRSKLILNIC